MADTLTCAKAPCKSCPYRRDVPSGVWARNEYEKLPVYDGDIPEQAEGRAGPFMCHQQDGKLCAGWVGCHGASNLLAMRLFSDRIDESVWDYKSPVPLFDSGAEAAAHGMRDMRRPKREARAAINRLLKKQRRSA